MATLEQIYKQAGYNVIPITQNVVRAFEILREKAPMLLAHTEIPKISLHKDRQGPSLPFVSVHTGEPVQRIYKSAEGSASSEERYMLGVVLYPNDGQDGAPLEPDTAKQVYSRDAVRRACHWYMEHGRWNSLFHGPRQHSEGQILRPDDERVVLLENYLSPVAIPKGTFGETQTFDLPVGTWLQAYRINDAEIWEMIKSGAINGLSIGGAAILEEIEGL